jgi:hypothetical protein
MKALQNREIGLELENSENGTEKIGKDPRTLSREALEALGHEKLSLLQVIRARCMDCSCFQPSEVRKCTAVGCPSWPYRMGTNPFRDKKELTEEHKAKLHTALAKARAIKNGDIEDDEE